MSALPPLAQSIITTPLGAVHLAASARGLAGLWFAGQRHLPPQLAGPDAWPTRDDHPLLRAAAAQVQEYFAAERVAFDIPLDLRGTALQQDVWRALCAIPHGETISYAALAKRLGRPRAVRAVAGAVGRNPVSVIVPCHRVLGSTGSLTGYAGGIERKASLLRLEGALAPAT